jgi:hypothetical protein
MRPGALSRECHHPYKLVPTPTELTSWINAADQLISIVNNETGHSGNAMQHSPASGRLDNPEFSRIDEGLPHRT